MKKTPSTILFLLISAGIVVATATQGQAATTSKKKTSTSSTATASAKTSVSVAKLKAMPAAANLHESSSLYNSSNAQYVDTRKSLFDFGPKSQNIKYDKRMIMAAQIAAERAHKHSTMRCWSYVKNALVSAHVISSRPTTGYAKQAGDELQSKYGFKKLAINDPYKAPLGSVLVYGGKGAGHVEIRTAKGFVSDFTTEHASRRPLIGVYVKPS